MYRQTASMWKYPVGWLAVLAVLLAGGSHGLAQNWPRFRGPNGQGIGQATALPARWSLQDCDWRVELPGGGHSSPVVWGDRVFVTSGDDRTRRGAVLCLDASSGRELWRKEYELDKVKMNALNSYASATPALDGDHVYLFWPGAGETRLAALTHDGREVWTAGLPGMYARHGVGSSPVVFGRHVIVSREQDEGGGAPSVWLALDCKTGSTQWRYEHPENADGSYSTPCVYRDGGGHDQLIFASNSHGLAGIDPAAGKLLWKTASALPARVVGSPVIAGQIVIATCGQGGRGKRLAAVMPPATEAPSAASERYALASNIVPYVPTPLAHDGLLFAFHDMGTVSCLRSATGEVLWSEKPAGRYYGSPVWADGKLYCMTIDGDVVVLKAGPEYALLAVNALGEKSHATPAIANGRIYLRTYSHLMAIGGRQD